MFDSIVEKLSNRFKFSRLSRTVYGLTTNIESHSNSRQSQMLNCIESEPIGLFIFLLNRESSGYCSIFSLSHETKHTEIKQTKISRSKDKSCTIFTKH